MKQRALMLIYFICVLMTLCICLADWRPNNKVVETVTTGFSWTNEASATCRIASYMADYVDAATGTVTFEIVDPGVSTQVVKVSSLSGVTNLSLGSAEFSGFYLYTDDVFLVTDTCGTTNVSTLIPEGTD